MFHLDKKGVKTSFYKYCECCDYTASQKSNWDRHLKTKKHKKFCFTFVSKTSKKRVNAIFKCIFCEKVCKSRTTLWRHKKKCSLAKKNDVVESKTQTIVQNITNNINYNCFNVFLDEHCKDAQTLKDFVDNINLSLKDLDYTTQNGYVKGISNILNKQLEDLSPTDRPIHSTDAHRLKFMVKNKDGWVKDDGSQLNKVVIRETKFKLVKSLSDWEKKNPDYSKNIEKKELWQKSLDAISPHVDLQEKYNKVINKNISKFSIKDAINSLND